MIGSRDTRVQHVSGAARGLIHGWAALGWCALVTPGRLGSVCVVRGLIHGCRAGRTVAHGSVCLIRVIDHPINVMNSTAIYIYYIHM
jgi:hypothetical protein